MSLQTSKTLYKKHAYSGPRKSIKKVQAAIRRHHHAEVSRVKIWRSEEKKKKPVNEGIVIDNSVTAQNKPLRTYARVPKPKIHLEATYSAPSSTVTADLVVKPLEINWPHVDPEILIDSVCETSECEYTSENDTIDVFCPKCNTKVPHTAEGIQQDQTKILTTKVYHYFEQEYKELKTLYGNVDLSPLSKFRQRTTLATGVSDSMLQQILEEEKPREQDFPRRPHKRRMDEDSSSDESTPEDSDGDAEADNGEQEPEQPHTPIETLVVKIEQPEITIDEPEIFVPAPLKTEPVDYDANIEQLQKDPISLDIKTEPHDDEMEIAIETIQPGTSKYKERKRIKKSQDTSTQNDFDGCKEESTSEEEMPTLTGTLENDTEKTAIEKEEVFACTCFMGCLSKRCLCKKKKLLCNPRCHYNVNCMNK